MRILLAEDHREFAENLIDYLAQEHEVDLAVDGRSALSYATRAEYDALIVDLGLPRLKGLELCRLVREQDPQAPILILTSSDSLDDKVAAFEAGADDYLVKPCEFVEVSLRLRALSRRAQWSSSRDDSSRLLEVGDLRFNLATQEIDRGATPIKLHRIGRDLLALLMKHSPELVSRQMMIDEVWNGDPPGSEVIRTHIYALRKAIETESGPKYLHNVRGSGYRLAVPGETRFE